MSAELHHDIADWLACESALLDARDYSGWLALMHPAIRYRMPVTVTTARRNAGRHPLGESSHFDEDLHSLAQRVRRLEGDAAWTEDPASRTRRHLSGIRVVEHAASEVEVASNVLVFRSRGDVHPSDLLSARRVDQLVRNGDDDWFLIRRDITFDESVLHTQNLALFL